MIVDERVVLEYLRKHRANVLGKKNDLVVPVTGPERMGKSTIAYRMARLLDSNFDVRKQIVFHAKQFKRRSVELPRHSSLILDEAIFGGFSRRAMSGDNVGLVQHLTVSGDRYNFNFICWPAKQWLDPIIRDWRSTFNVHVIRRGVAQIRLFHEGETVYDPPRVLFTFTFPVADDEDWKIYEQMKEEFVQANGRNEDNSAGADFLDYKATIEDNIRPIVQDLVDL